MSRRVYWCGKAFFALLLPEDNIFWTATENEGPWEKEMAKGKVYNKYQPGPEILITDYPNSGASEIRAWCNVPIIPAWEKFRGSENYNRLAYNSEFPWMADSLANGISKNYALKNKDDQWEVLRMYTFKKFEDGVYYRDAVLETNPAIRFNLADIPLPDGILRVDRVTSPVATDIRLGHYSLPESGQPVTEKVKKQKKQTAYLINNGKYEQAMLSLHGWKALEFITGENVHPESSRCKVINSTDRLPDGTKVYVTLQLWKKGSEGLSEKELSPVRSVTVAADNQSVAITFSDGSRKTIDFR